MPLLLVLALLLPMVWAAALLCGRCFEEAAPLVALGLFVLLYALGWAGVLAAGPWLLWGLWLAAMAYLIWTVVLKHRFALSQLTAGFALFVLCAAALWWLCRGRRYANWDEFSHWGRALKAVFYENLLPALASLKDEFREYPPGVAPFQVAVMKAAFIGWREDVAIWLQGLFSVSLLIYPLRRFPALFGASGGGGRGLAALGAGGLLFLAPAMVFWNYYTETTVDGLLGLLFAFVVLVELAGEGRGFERALQCLACAALPLVKASGLLWALMAFAALCACRRAAARRRAQPGGQAGLAPRPRSGRAAAEGADASRKHRAQKLLCAALPLLCALAAQGSWSAFMALHDVPRRWSASGFSLGALWQLVTNGQPAWRAGVARDYFANLFADTNYGWPAGFMPYMGFFALFIAAWALLRRAEKKEPVATGFTAGFWALLACGAAYVLFMLFGYLFIFSEYEAVRLASLSRYLNTYLAGMAVFMLGWVAALAARRPQKRIWPALAAAAALWLLCGNPAAVLGGFAKAPQNAVPKSLQRGGKGHRRAGGRGGKPPVPGVRGGHGRFGHYAAADGLRTGPRRLAAGSLFQHWAGLCRGRFDEQAPDGGGMGRPAAKRGLCLCVSF